MIHAPQILFLDEPTTGTDVEIRELILELKAQGTTVFITTHYIEAAERIAFLVGGRIVASARVAWGMVLPAVVLIAVTSTLPGLLIAVSAKQVFEAQSFSNFFRFPMLFLCGLFMPLSALPGFCGRCPSVCR